MHFDPDAALAAGFPPPILHGLASYGMAGAAVSRALGYVPAAVARLACRFAGVVFPGDTLDFEVWREGSDDARLRARVDGRTVLDGGEIAWKAL